MSAKSPLIKLDALSKAYGRRSALEALSIDVGAGELVALVGENGAGKTTALAIVSGQLVPDSGRALITGQDVFAQPIAARRALGYVAQDLLLPPYVTAEEIAIFVCGVKEIGFDRRRFDQLLELTGLTDDADRLVGELSHGMQRKAAWVVALSADPKVLVLDEGLAGLDATSAAALVGEVERLLGRGVGVLWAEHDLELMAPRVDRVVVLHGGRLSEVVDGDELRADMKANRLDETMKKWTAVASSAIRKERS